MAKKDKIKQEVVIYNTIDGKIEVEATFFDDNLWLSLNQIAALFDKDKSTISRHIKNILEEGELDKGATVAKIATVQNEGGEKSQETLIITTLT